MSHYDIDYSDMTPQTKHLKAIADIKDYMGEDRYHKITQAIRADGPMSVDKLRIIVSLAGVQGYPVRAWHDEIWPYG